MNGNNFSINEADQLLFDTCFGFGLLPKEDLTTRLDCIHTEVVRDHIVSGMYAVENAGTLRLERTANKIIKETHKLSPADGNSLKNALGLMPTNDSASTSIEWYLRSPYVSLIGSTDERADQISGELYSIIPFSVSPSIRFSSEVIRTKRSSKLICSRHNSKLSLHGCECSRMKYDIMPPRVTDETNLKESHDVVEDDLDISSIDIDDDLITISWKPRPAGWGAIESQDHHHIPSSLPMGPQDILKPTTLCTCLIDSILPCLCKLHCDRCGSAWSDDTDLEGRMLIL